MGSLTAQEFVLKNIRTDEIKGKSIIEVGLYIVNFSVRSLFQFLIKALISLSDLVSIK